MQITKPSPRTNQGLLFVVLICFSLPIVLAILFFARGDAAKFLPIVVLLGVITVPMLFVWLRGKLDLFEPIQILSAIFALNFAVRAIYLLGDFNIPGYTTSLGTLRYDDTVPLALWYTILGFLSLLAGYYSGIPGILVRTFPSMKLKWSDSIPTSSLVAIYLVGLVAIFIRIRSGEVVGRLASEVTVSDETFLLATLSSFTVYAFAIALLCVLGKPAPSRLLYFVLVIAGLTIIAQSFIFGRKIDIVTVVFFFAAIFNYVRQRISFSRVAILGVVVVILVFPTLNLYRSRAAETAGAFAQDPRSLANTVEDVSGYIGQYDPMGYAQLAIVNLMSRSHGIDSLTLIMKLTPETIDYLYGADYLMIPAYAFIPRFLWPDKPANRGAEFGRRYIIDPLEASNSFTSFGMFHIGDLYMNFGVPGIILGMFILGIMYRGIYEYLAPNRTQEPMRVFLYVAIMWILMPGFESDIATVFSNFLKTFLFILAISWFLRAKE